MQPLTSDDPATIGNYRLQARLGSGGMGRVYLAHTPAGRPVALKVVRSELSHDRDFRVRFRQEILAAQRVRGLYTAELIDADPAATPPWLVTAYVPGPSLEEVIDGNGPMPEAMVFRLIAGVAEALQAIHAVGVIHRDLKPSNVLLAQDGPRVIDFGIARALAATPLTLSDVMMGSPDFLSPEQILDRPITPAIDVFALGSLAAFAATGRLPFGQGHMTEVAHRVVHELPDLTGCPVRLLTLIEACLEKQAEVRPAPGQVVEFCLARAAELPGPGQPPSQPQPWPGLGLTADPPEHSARSAGSATAVLPDLAVGGNVSTGADASTAGAASAGGDASRGKRRLTTAVVGLAAAILAAAVIVIAMTSHLAAEGTAAGRGNAARHPAARAAGAVRAAGHATDRGRRPAAAKRPPAPPPAVVLLSQGHPVSASSAQGYPWAAAYAVDGNLGTRWSSAWSDPQWLEVDLGAIHPVTKVVLYWERAYATAFQIQVSDNGTTWTDVYSTTTGTGGVQTVPVRGADRYVRMYGTRRVTQYGYSLWEFQVFGT
jgi:eukaryotic-like serine/threonine-protein kinase